MDKRKIILITIVLIMIVGIIITLVILLTPLSYDRVLSIANRKITNTKEVTINYKLMIEGNYEGSYIDESTTVQYQKRDGVVNWEHNLTQIKGTIYDLTPEEVISMLTDKTNLTGYLVNQDYPTQSCQLIKSEMFRNLTSTKVKNPQELVMMACFNLSTGYPEYYTIGVRGQGSLVVGYESYD